MAVETSRYAYMRAETLDRALELLAADPGGARVLAGGQSLVPMLRSGMAAPTTLIDVNRLSELAYIECDGETLRIGALTRTRDVERSEVVRKAAPLLADAVAWVAYPQVRNRGTVGGNLAHGDPAAQIGGAVLALEGAVLARRKAGGRREIAAADFFRYWFETALADDELLVELVLPVRPPGAGWSYLEVARPPGSPVHAGVAAHLELDAGAVARAALAFIGVAPTPVRLPTLERRLEGRTVDDALLDEAAEAIRAELEPVGDAAAPADYRKHVAAVLARRALAEAAAWARDDAPA